MISILISQMHISMLLNSRIVFLDAQISTHQFKMALPFINYSNSISNYLNLVIRIQFNQDCFKILNYDFD